LFLVEGPEELIGGDDLDFVFSGVARPEPPVAQAGVAQERFSRLASSAASTTAMLRPAQFILSSSQFFFSGSIAITLLPENRKEKYRAAAPILAPASMISSSRPRRLSASPSFISRAVRLKYPSA